ncbi:MAG: septation protein A [Rhizobiales bacterium]|nr:septation protein A [Hyphomicrobiales bacterium]OJY07025.1 MAG: septation protein A [Rhizobiales bacterium 63-22]
MDHPVFETDPTEETAAERKQVPPLPKFLLELGPGLVFFFVTLRGEWLAQKFPVLALIGAPILIATAFFMAATAISLVVSWLMTRRLPIMPLVSAIVVFVFGALAIWLQDKTFAYMKPTIINALFGVVLLGGLMFRKSLLAYIFDAAFRLDAEGWRKLTFRWGLFFLFLAALNEIVWRSFSEDTWLYFKVWGTIPITVIFTLSQMPLIQKHSLTEDDGPAS